MNHDSQSLLSHYLKITKPKLIKAFAISFVIICVVMYGLGVILFFAKRNSKTFDTSGMGEAAVVVPLVSAALSVFVLVLAIWSEVVEMRRLRIAFERQPLQGLATSGFQTVRILEGSLWKIYKEVRLSRIRGYLVVADIQTKDHASFNFLIAEHVDEMPPLTESQRVFTFSRNSAGLVVTVPTVSVHFPSGDSLMNLFEAVAHWLNARGYTPGADIRGYESMIKAELMSRGIKAGLGG